MKRQRKQYSAYLKAKIAVEAVKRQADEPLLQNLEREPFLQLLSGGTEDCSDGSSGSPFPPDHLADVALSNS